MLPQQYVKDPSHSAKSAGGRLQLNTHTHPTYVVLNEVTIGVHETCAETAAFHVAPAMQHLNSVINTPLPWILMIRAIKGYSQDTHSESHANVRSESAREQRIALYKSYG